MGLDQYAYVKNAQTGEAQGGNEFVWRKHAKLQTFMEHLFCDRTGKTIRDLNCGELELTTEDIDRLEGAVKTNALPHCDGGFFYGVAMQEEQAKDLRDYDLEFCAWARAEINAGQTVIYSCWW